MSKKLVYFPQTDISPEALERSTWDPDLEPTSWYTVKAGAQHAARAAWQHVDVPTHAGELKERIAFAWRAMDACQEEGKRMLRHASDSNRRIDIRPASRNLVVRHQYHVVADTKRPVVLCESGVASRWSVPRADIDEHALTFEEHHTFCPYKGPCSYYDIGDARQAAWPYREAYSEAGRISGLVSFEADVVSVQLDATQIRLEPGQTVVPYGPDRELTVAEARPRG